MHWMKACGSLTLAVAAAHAAIAQPAPVPDKTVVLTFDDAVKSHLTVVAPILKEHGFGATFFVTHAWMDDTENFMTWEDIAQLHEMGFEIGNHTYTHAGMGSPKGAGWLEGELALVESALAKAGVPKPVSFAWPGNGFSTEGVNVLERLGYRFARRGMQPEVPYGQLLPGPLYNPAANHPLLIPSAGDAYPEWTLDNFKAAVDRAKDGKIAVVQFHGVPDTAHPWVHTPPERFQEYMDYLADNGFNVIAMRDVADHVDLEPASKDAMLKVRYGAGDPVLELPQEVTASRADAPFWLAVMQRHDYTLEEMAQVFAHPQRRMEELLNTTEPAELPATSILPYPGGRHPRIGFLDGAVSPMRGSKVSVFTPWNDGGYVLVDLPEAIFSNLGLTFLAHTHIPTIWDDANKHIENRDWTPTKSGGWSNSWTLPNDIQFGASIEPVPDGADMELWLENGTEEPLTNLRTQICLMLKGVPGLTRQTKEGKRIEDGIIAAQVDATDRWVLVGFEQRYRGWQNEDVPCIHSDPTLPDAQPGERVSVRGRLVFYKGGDVTAAMARLADEFPPLDE